MLHNQKTTIVKIGENSFTVSYPNVGQQFDIESNKLFLTTGGYGDLARSGHIKANRLLDMVDAYSTFKVLVPKLKLELEDFFKLDDLAALQLVQAYKTYYIPFYQKMEDEINKLLEEIKKADADTTE